MAKVYLHIRIRKYELQVNRRNSPLRKAAQLE